MSDFSDFTPVGTTAPPPGRGSGSGGRGDPPPGSGNLSQEEQAASDNYESHPSVEEERRREMIRHPESAAILSDPAKNGTALVKASGFDDFKPPLKAPGAPQAKPASKNAFGFKLDPETPTGLPGVNLGEAVSAVDLILSAPAMMVGALADTAKRLEYGYQSTKDWVEGKAPLTYAQDYERRKKMGKEATDEFSRVMEDNNPYSIAKILRLDTSKTELNRGMEKVSTFIEKTGGHLEIISDGTIMQEDFVSLVNDFMAAGGAKGMKAGGEGLSALIAKKKAEGVKSPVAAAVTDYSFGMDLPKEQRDVLREKGEKADDNARVFHEDNTREPAPKPGGMPDSQPITVERAAKASSTPEFLRTPEDKIALRGWAEQGGETAGFERAAEAAAKPGFLRTAEDKAWLQKYGSIAAASIAGLAAWDALDPDSKDHAQTLTAMALGLALPEAGRHERSLKAISELGPATPLGAVLTNSSYGMKTLERLPQGSFDFSKEHIQQELKRQDVTDPERAAIKQALDGVPGDRVTAKDLVLGVRKATGDFELTPKETDQYADYGLSSIGRQEHEISGNEPWLPEDGTPEEIQRLVDEHQARQAPANATTTLYRLPAHMEMGDANHFSDKNLFGWTRSFEEGGVRHVVEIQSDLAQKNKGLSEEARVHTQTQLEEAQARAARVKRDMDAASDEIGDRENIAEKAVAAQTRYRKALQEYRQATAEVAEKQAALEGAGRADSVAPVVKNWPKRLVREELGKAARARDRLQQDIASFDSGGAVKNPDYVARARAAVEAGKVVRFATADTVAKVEGWPEVREMEERMLAEQKASLQYAEKGGSLGGLSPEESAARLRREIARKEEQLKAMTEEFSPQHQSIYDRYKRDIEKFLKQQGGTPYTDPHGHTWLEVPVPKKGPVQMYGHADPKLLGIIAAGMVGAYLGYEAFDTISGGLIGAFGGHLAMKAIPGLRESLSQTPAAKAAMVELRDRLYTLQQANKARGLDMLNLVTKSIPPDWPKYAEEIFNHLDKGTSLSERAESLKAEFIDPILDANKRAVGELARRGYPVKDLVDSLESHRVRKGGKASIFETLERGALPSPRSLSPATPIDQSVNRWSTPSGESAIGVKEAGGKVALYTDGKITAKGSINAKTGELKIGDKTYQKSRATTEDIEKHTEVRYHKEPLLAALDNSLKLGTALANAQFLDKLVDMPGFEEFAKKVPKGEAPPEGWKQPVGVTKLGEYHFEPRMYEVIEDFMGGKQGPEWAKALQRVNRVMIGSMFWNPLPHILNVADHALVEKGLIGNVVGFPQTLKSSFEAYREVNRLGPKYRAYLREGAAFMYPDTLLGDFTGKVLKAVGSEKGMGPVAQAFGYVNPAEMVKRLYDGSREALWRWNDIIMMQAYLAKEAKGMTKSEALREVEKHIPSYRLPERIMGSRALQSALASPVMTTFGRYDYGRLASYGHMIKDLTGKERSVKERLHALDQMAMLAVAGTLIYPIVMDTFAQSLTGNKNAEWTRFGASTIPTLAMKLWNGEELASNALSKMFHLSPMWELLPEMMFNKDLHQGGQFAHTPGEAVTKIGKQIAPINMMAQGESGKQTKEQLFWSAIGVKSPSDEQVEKKHKYIARQKAEIDRFKAKGAAK